MALVPLRCPWLSPASGLTLSTGYLRWLTCNRFAENVIRAFKGESGIVAPTFVYLPGVPGGDAIAKATGVDFFSVPVALGV